ncbi:transporter substrate-binding domain-containing protein [Vibrio sp. S4M6]|uniref:substrate-binding periplasmic protein n=1 Tax=Vibrio sinus TaxID=2946865 RepID=UPI00202A1675|nr:transporter substrate-binding domain-containing protein [Vibrio sinus]MCL9781511.1 transporter substrate-binding domain-containing protein [Vibrio sinus]
MIQEKHWRTFISACALMLVCWFTTPVYASECQQIKVSGSTGWHPLLIQDETTGEISGLAYDIMSTVSRQVSTPFEFLPRPWKRALLNLQQGRIDIILGIYWTKQRAQTYNYSSPIFQNEARVWVLKDKTFTFEKLADLIGKRGDIPLGGSFGEEFDHYAEQHLSLREIGKKNEHIARLLINRSDFFISDYYDTLPVLREMGVENKVVPLDMPVSTTQVYFAFSRSSPCAYLAADINNAIERLRNEGTLKKLINKYLVPN